jgi:hypothetical protein
VSPASELTGIQLFGSGAKFVPLIFYHILSIVLDIYELKKVKNHKTIELKGSMDGLMKSSNMQQSTIEVIQLFISQIMGTLISGR